MTDAQQSILDGVHDLARREYIMILSDECREVLQRLFAEHSPKRVLEIGTAIGYSSSIMALSSDCVIDTVEKDCERIAKAKQLWKSLGIVDKINAYLGDSEEILPKVTYGKTYDFIFIDAGKSAYKRQLEFLLPHLEVGGIALCDDVLYLGLVKGDSYPPHKHRTIVRNMREFLAYVENHPCHEMQLYEEGNGIAVIKKIKSESK